MEKKKRHRRPKFDIEIVRKLFQKNGDKLLTNTYLGAKQKLLYRCGGCKGLRTVVYNNYYRNSRCKFCAIKRRMNPNGKMLQKIVLRQEHFTTAEVCRMFGFDYADFQKHVNYDLLPQPTRLIGLKRYYTEEGIKVIRKLVKL